LFEQKVATVHPANNLVNPLLKILVPNNRVRFFAYSFTRTDIRLQLSVAVFHGQHLQEQCAQTTKLKKYSGLQYRKFRPQTRFNNVFAGFQTSRNEC